MGRSPSTCRFLLCTTASTTAASRQVAGMPPRSTTIHGTGGVVYQAGCFSCLCWLLSAGKAVYACVSFVTPPSRRRRPCGGSGHPGRLPTNSRSTEVSVPQDPSGIHVQVLHHKPRPWTASSGNSRSALSPIALGLLHVTSRQRKGSTEGERWGLSGVQISRTGISSSCLDYS